MDKRIKFQRVLVHDGVLYCEFLRQRLNAPDEWEPDCLRWPVEEVEAKLKRRRQSQGDDGLVLWAKRRLDGYRPPSRSGGARVLSQEEAG